MYLRRNVNFLACDFCVCVLQLGVDETYEILHVLEFTSTRKRMSVVVRAPDGKIKLMIKGAVSVWYP